MVKSILVNGTITIIEQKLTPMGETQEKTIINLSDFYIYLDNDATVEKQRQAAADEIN